MRCVREKIIKEKVVPDQIQQASIKLISKSNAQAIS